MKNSIRKIIKEEISLLNEKTDYSKEKDKGLHGWFERQGGKGKSSGWVDCNTCRKDSKTGRKKCKPCGREEGEKRSKYPACRPTPGACDTKGKGKKWGKKSKKNESFVVEKWSEKYKKSIDCNNPKGFSQKAHCQGRKKKNEQISEGLQYHLDRNIPLTENIYRYGSEAFFNLINETRELYYNGDIELSFVDRELIETNIGEKAMFEGKEVWLDIPMEDTEILSEEDRFKGKKSGSPQRDASGGKAYKVYVAGCAKKTDSNPRGIKLVRFGSGGLKAKLSNKEAKKSFNARHGCSEGRHNDKCKAGYYSCRLPRYAKALGLSGGGTWW